MSATMDVDLFSQYFNKSPVLYLEGRQHPIQIYYTKQTQTDYLQAACNLASVILQLLALGVPDVLNFDFMSKPSPESLRTAVEQLCILGAVDRKDDQVSLTPLGKKMACFPLEPRFSKF
ncbi:ATP-dependent RNA helicase DHX33 [Labeo rohita]|uniref:RNA helicase n=1 Tax=Labeo rohita TaxID=84645 RepID=A0A498P4K7_LABRO|nr:ATP-dependent RNA helicase DHX33 [Labeo rohita]